MSNNYSKDNGGQSLII